MHINLFHRTNRANTALAVPHIPSSQHHKRSSETTSLNQPRTQDRVTLSQEAMKALQVDYRLQAKNPSASDNDDKINSLEKWVDKAVTRTEANNGNIPFGMKWKLEYLNTRITKALDTDIGPKGNILNLTESQQEKLSQINERINGLLSPVSNTESTTRTAASLEDKS
ncbi:hypothetical protein [Kiloniella majae]|uniref:hypothetical protein n=1 Tax=Kiloniella majae TaxID=1938558 RepID=UPI000F7B5F82|nr:hypothetical protein [Kiloniella majae]